MSVNICGGDDPFARYKRETVVIDVDERKKITRVFNLSRIAKSLNRNHKMIADYIKRSFNTSYTEKENYIVYRGIFTNKEIESIIVQFTEKFVLCNVCNNPETELFDKNKTIVKKCKACGNNS